MRCQRMVKKMFSDFISRNFIRFFRNETYPTLYDDLNRKILIDVTLFRITSLFLVAFLAFLVILPGFRRGNKKFNYILRWTCSMIIFYLMIYCNFMPYWEHGTVKSRMPYRFGTNAHIKATLQIKIGLRGMNVTLTGDPIHQHGDIIDLNEYFDWTWDQGRPGFGYDAGKLYKSYRQAQRRGLPYPILWVAETLTIDYEQIHFGRWHRKSGWLAHIFLWTAVPLFLLSNILFQMVIYYGSLAIIFTGITLWSANLVLVLYRSPIPFSLAFENDFLTTHYCWCFYLNLLNGLACIIIGIITLVADLRMPDETAEFFGNDVLQSYEDYFADPQQDKNCPGDDDLTTNIESGVMLRKKKPGHETRTNGQAEPAAVVPASGLKKRTISDRFSRFQKSTIRKVAAQPTAPSVPEPPQPRPPPYPSEEPEMPLYENFRPFTPIGEETFHDENEL